MKYADSHDFTSQFELVSPRTKRPNSIREKIRKSLNSFFTPRFDLTRMNKTEQREAGIRDCEIDWYNALHGPVIK